MLGTELGSLVKAASSQLLSCFCRLCTKAVLALRSSWAFLFLILLHFSVAIPLYILLLLLTWDWKTTVRQLYFFFNCEWARAWAKWQHQLRGNIIQYQLSVGLSVGPVSGLIFVSHRTCSFLGFWMKGTQPSSLLQEVLTLAICVLPLKGWREASMAPAHKPMK